MLWHAAYRRLLQTAIDSNTALPTLPDSLNPFLLLIKEGSAEARARHERRAIYDTSTVPAGTPRPLTTAGQAGVHNRGIHRHEDDAARWAAGHVCYVYNKLADAHWEYILNGLPAGYETALNLLTLWLKTIKGWRTKWQWQMMTSFMCNAMKSFAALAGTARLADMIEARREEL